MSGSRLANCSASIFSWFFCATALSAFAPSWCSADIFYIYSFEMFSLLIFCSLGSAITKNLPLSSWSNMPYSQISLSYCLKPDSSESYACNLCILALISSHELSFASISVFYLFSSSLSSSISAFDLLLLADALKRLWEFPFMAIWYMIKQLYKLLYE